MKLFAEVVLPLRINQLYTYEVPATLQAHALVGARVIVPVQKQKYMGLILRTHSDPPSLARVQPVIEILDSVPLLFPQQLELWHWLETYYVATPNDVLHTMLPAGLRLERKSIVQLVEPYAEMPQMLTEPQQRMLAFIQEKKYPSIDQLENQDWGRSTTRLLKELLELGLVEVQDRLTERTHPRRVRYVHFSPNLTSREAITQLLETLQRKQAQMRVILAMLSLLQTRKLPLNEWLTAKEVQTKANVPLAVLDALEKAHCLEVEEREESRIPPATFEQEIDFVFSPLQQAAYSALCRSMERHEVTLLHGVTGSGKTEIYIRLIKETLARGQQVLYLLPEITLTEYMIARIQAHFGAEVSVYHSRLSEALRTELYRLLHDEPQRIKLVLGVRSSLFLPFSNLGLVIVDEEHESSYKQQNPSPRYQARDLAIMLAHIHKAKVVLGSATPSVESYTNALRGKYGLVELNTRYGDAQPPQFELVDMRLAYHRKEYVGHFSDRLLEAIETTVAQKNQVILFQNRRGYAPHIECIKCGWVAVCPNCDVSLTYHRATQQLRCHYCGYTEPMQTVCPACKSAEPRLIGLGTQRVEEELAQALPQLRIARLDVDTTSRKEASNTILDNFAHGEIDVLVGTQMVAKGLDFNSVHLVGILDADSMLRLPDFRANERAFQLIAQVGGRAGRRATQGRVLIQTRMPELELFHWVQSNDYKAFYEKEIAERSVTHYPPYIRLVMLTLSHASEKVVTDAANIFQQRLCEQMHCEIFGPMIPLIAFMERRFLQQILLKIRPQELQYNKSVLFELVAQFRIQYPAVFVSVDVDPY